MNRKTIDGLLMVFAIFAAGYLLSSLLRGVTAALAPVFTAEFHADPAQLGLLAGAYFASFALLQLPMGAWLDRYGVRTILIASLGIATPRQLRRRSADAEDFCRKALMVRRGTHLRQ